MKKCVSKACSLGFCICGHKRHWSFTFFACNIVVTVFFIKCLMSFVFLQNSLYEIALSSCTNPKNLLVPFSRLKFSFWKKLLFQVYFFFFFYCKDAIWSFYFYLNMSQNVFLCKTFSNFVWVFKLTGYCQNNSKPASISQLSKLWFPWRQTAHQWTFKQKGREWHEARSSGIVLVIEGLQVGSSSVGGSHSLDYAPVS